MPNILQQMPNDGNAPGQVFVGDYGTAGASLAWDTVRDIPHGVNIGDGRTVPVTAAPQPTGRIFVRCFQKGFNTHIVTQAAQNNLGFAGTSHSLYWLPWGHGTVANVSWGNLEGSNLFLTSTFTGCRFVVNSKGVSHVAWGGHGYDVDGDMSSRGRDNAELRAGIGLPDMGRVRRSMSISGNLPSRHNEQKLTYIQANESCVVIGWKNGNRWTFKAIKMKVNSPMRSRWYTVAEVDTVGGVVTII